MHFEGIDNGVEIIGTSACARADAFASQSIRRRLFRSARRLNLFKSIGSQQARRRTCVLPLACAMPLAVVFGLSTLPARALPAASMQLFRMDGHGVRALPAVGAMIDAASRAASPAAQPPVTVALASPATTGTVASTTLSPNPATSTPGADAIAQDTQNQNQTPPSSGSGGAGAGGAGAAAGAAAASSSGLIIGIVVGAVVVGVAVAAASGAFNGGGGSNNSSQ